MKNIDIIIDAIRSKKPISFEYNKPGKTSGIRIGNPHALYIFTPKDETKPKSTKLDLVQTDGPSETKTNENEYPACSQFDIEHLTNIVILSDEPDFEIDSIYKPESDRYKDVIEKV